MIQWARTHEYRKSVLIYSVNYHQIEFKLDLNFIETFLSTKKKKYVKKLFELFLIKAFFTINF